MKGKDVVFIWYSPDLSMHFVAVDCAIDAATPLDAHGIDRQKVPGGGQCVRSRRSLQEQGRGYTANG